MKILTKKKQENVAKYIAACQFIASEGMKRALSYED